MGTLHLPPFILIFLVRQSKPIMLSESSSHTEKLSVAFQASFTGLIWRRTVHQSLLARRTFDDCRKCDTI